MYDIVFEEGSINFRRFFLKIMRQDKFLILKLKLVPRRSSQNNVSYIILKGYYSCIILSALLNFSLLFILARFKFRWHQHSLTFNKVSYIVSRHDLGSIFWDLRKNRQFSIIFWVIILMGFEEFNYMSGVKPIYF